MDIKAFKLSWHTSPEWGQSYDYKSQYYISNDVEKVIRRVHEEHGWHLEESGDSWKYDHYYSGDREELNVILEEIDCEMVI